MLNRDIYPAANPLPKSLQTPSGFWLQQAICSPLQTCELRATTTFFYLFNMQKNEGMVFLLCPRAFNYNLEFVVFGRFAFLRKEMIFCAPFSSSGQVWVVGQVRRSLLGLIPPLPAKAKQQHISLRKAGGQSCTLKLSPGCYFYIVGSSITGMFSLNEWSVWQTALTVKGTYKSKTPHPNFCQKSLRMLRTQGDFFFFNSTYCSSVCFIITLHWRWDINSIHCTSFIKFAEIQRSHPFRDGKFWYSEKWKLISTLLV